jgi:hypothetical protein
MAVHCTPVQAAFGPNAEATIYARQRILQLRQQMLSPAPTQAAESGNVKNQLIKMENAAPARR